MEASLNQITELSCEIKDLNVFYDRKQVLRDVSFNIPPKKVTALLGPSGCGKSTLLNCLNRLSELNHHCSIQGSIDWSGIPVYPECQNSLLLRRTVGYIAQQPNPFPTSIENNFHLPLKELGIHNKDQRLGIMEENLKRVGLLNEIKDQLKQNALHLSGGQQQRLCLARALALKPKALLMDEPTSSLDPISTEKIEALIHELKTTYTIVLVTHNIGQAKRLADHLVVFWTQNNIGECLESGNKDKILTHPNDHKTLAYLNREMS